MLSTWPSERKRSSSVGTWESAYTLTSGEVSSTSLAFGIRSAMYLQPSSHFVWQRMSVGTEIVGSTSRMSVSISTRMNHAAAPGLAARRSWFTCHCSNSGSSR